jgi:hypothetical protein
VRKAGGTVEREVILTDSRDRKLDIIGLQSSGPHISLSSESYKDKRLRDDLKRFLVRVRLCPEKMDLGEFKSEVVISTSSTDMPRLEIAATGKILGNIVIQPPQLFFGFVNPGETCGRSLSIISHAGRFFEITGIENHIEGLRLGYWREKTERSYTLQAMYYANADRPSAKVMGFVKAFTNDEFQPILQIPVVAVIRNRGASDGRGI